MVKGKGKSLMRAVLYSDFGSKSRLENPTFGYSMLDTEERALFHRYCMGFHWPSERSEANDSLLSNFEHRCLCTALTVIKLMDLIEKPFCEQPTDLCK